MRTRFVLVALGILVTFSTQNLMGKKTALPSALSVRQQVDSELANLKKNIKLANSMDGKWKFLDKSTRNIKALRSSSSRQFEGDEIYMDMVMNSLDDVPRGTKFKAGDCVKYRNHIIANYNPSQDTEPSEAVTQTLGVLDLLCSVKK